MKPADNINNLFENSKITVGKDVDKKIINKATSALPHSAPQPDRNRWSIIMHRKLTKYAAMVALLLILAGAVAVKIMTPAERIEVMDELEKSHGQPVYDPESHGEVAEEDKVTVAGTIKTWDGGIINRHTPMCLYVTRPGASSSIGIGPSFANGVHEAASGTFSYRCGYGSIFVSASAAGYAPACAGPFQLEPGRIKDDIEIVLEKGHPASILVMDAATQQPIRGVELTGGYQFRPNGYQYTLNFTTDDNGIVEIKHASDVKVALTARCKGYQQERFEKLELPKDTPLVLELEPSKPVEGVIVAKATGLPVEGAVIRTQMEVKPSRHSYSRDHGEILATSDTEGQFLLDQLAEDKKYILSIKADGYAYAFTDEVSAGDDNLMIELEEPIIISGRVVGPLERLPQKDGKPYIPYNCTFTVDYNGDKFSDTDLTQHAFVDIEANQGFFELTDLWGTSVRVGMEYWKQRIKLNEPLLDEIVLDLNDPLTEDGTPYHKRKLVLEFKTPDGFPPPTGNIRLNYIDPAYAENTYKGKLVEIIDGRAEAEIVAPGKIAYEIADTVGYWFKEVWELKVDNSIEPLVIQVPTVPAGMIFGQVFEEDGTPAGNTMVSCQIIKKSPLLDEKLHYSVSDLGKNSSTNTEIETKYTAAPLPLGGVYQLVAHRRNTYAVSEPIRLTEENPIWEVNLTFPKGVTLSGQVLFPDGTPAGGIKCHLHFSTSNNHGFGNQGQFTDSQGRFAFEQINPDVDGTYSFSIKPKKDYRPIRMELKKLTKPIVVQLEQGAIATGQVIDTETGWPIPGFEVTAYYHNYRNGNSEYEQIEAENKTDQNGRFHFSNMKADREYNLNLAGCRPSGTQAKIKSGQTDSVYEVSLSDWSQLKPRQPEGF